MMIVHSVGGKFYKGGILKTYTKSSHRSSSAFSAENAHDGCPSHVCDSGMNYHDKILESGKV
jgi:hypothetical protein